MSSLLLPFRYRDFYDVPRAILVEYAGTLYFFDCPFSDELDDYEDAFSVYKLSEELQGNLNSVSWETLPGSSSYVGSVPVDAVEFDSTKRHSIDARVFERLRMA